jgi:hypothetical protein
VATRERRDQRTGRTIYVGVVRRPGDTTTPVCINGLSVAAAESVPAHEADTLYTTIRHARIPAPVAAQFWRRVDALVREFSELPRAGDTVYGFAAGLYPTDHPVLPEANHEPVEGPIRRPGRGADRTGAG